MLVHSLASTRSLNLMSNASTHRTCCERATHPRTLLPWSGWGTICTGSKLLVNTRSPRQQSRSKTAVECLNTRSMLNELELHFMVQWFCLTSWKLFDGWMLYWRCWFSVTQTLTVNYICRSVTYISWSSDFALYLEDYLMDKCHNWNIGFVWCKDSPHKMYVGQWPTFRGPVNLSYILKRFW